MLLTIATTHRPATDLGHLLAKNPARAQSFTLGFGQAHVFYPEASEARCEAALLLDIDPIALARMGRRTGDSTLAQYVNDRPYVSSSFMSVAMAQVFRSAMKGDSKARPHLAETAINLEATVSCVAARGGEAFVRALFEPLGYEVAVEGGPLDETIPEWGPSPFVQLRLSNTTRLRDLLAHLYVLLPVLDSQKHYWVGQDEIEKLLSRGEGWLATHPAREQIVARYLRRHRPLVREALARLIAESEPDPDAEDEAPAPEEAIERPLRLHDQRIAAVVEAVRGAGSVADLGCGEGRLMQALLRAGVARLAGMDVSTRSLEAAADRLKLDRLPEAVRSQVAIFQGALTYRDERIAGFDAACLVEVIEHLEPSRLGAMEQVVFGFARPGKVVLTTPNAEYNARFESLPSGGLRHPDHRFEWSRAQFADWCGGVAARNGYRVSISGIGPEDEAVGCPSQLAVFER